MTDVDYTDNLALLVNTPFRAKSLLRTRIERVGTAIVRMSVISKSDLFHKTKLDSFQTVALSVLLYGCTTWTLMKRSEKNLDESYTSCFEQILEAAPYETAAVRQLTPISQTIQEDEQDMLGTISEVRMKS